MTFEQMLQYSPEKFSMSALNSPLRLDQSNEASNPSLKDSRLANEFFEKIKQRERSNSNLPELTFEVVEKGSGPHKTYVLNEHQKPSRFSKITRPEIGVFHIDDKGNISTKAQEFLPGPYGLMMRQTDQFTDAKSGRTTTKVFEGPAPKKSSPTTRLRQLSERTTDANGEEVSSVKFSYSEGKMAETVVNRNPDGSTRTQVFEGPTVEKLRPITQEFRGKDGTEISSTFAYSQDKVTQTVLHRKPDGSCSTQVFEGSGLDKLKLVSSTSRDENGNEKSSTKIDSASDKTIKTNVSYENDRKTTLVLEGTNNDDLRVKSELIEFKDGRCASTSFEYLDPSSMAIRKTVVTTDGQGGTRKQVFAGSGDRLKPVSDFISNNNGDRLLSSFDYSAQKTVQTVVARGADGSGKTQVIEGVGADRRLASELLTDKNGAEIQRITIEVTRNPIDGTTGLRETLARRDARDSSLTVTVFEGSSEQDLRPKRVTLSDAAGKELKRAIFEDIVDSEKKVVGLRQTVVSHGAQNTLTTSVFEGSTQEQLKEKERTITGANGKVIKRYVANVNGELVEKR